MRETTLAKLSLTRKVLTEQHHADVTKHYAQLTLERIAIFDKSVLSRVVRRKPIYQQPPLMKNYRIFATNYKKLEICLELETMPKSSFLSLKSALVEKETPILKYINYSDIIDILCWRLFVD